MSKILYRKASGITLSSAPDRTGESVDKKIARTVGANVKQPSAAQRKKGAGSGKKKTKTVTTAKKKAAGKASKKTSAKSPAKKK
jgi:hypothetical protein